MSKKQQNPILSQHYPDGCNLCGGEVLIKEKINRGIKWTSNRGFYIECAECGANTGLFYNGNPRPLGPVNEQAAARLWAAGAINAVIDFKHAYKGETLEQARAAAMDYLSKQLGREITGPEFMSTEEANKAFDLLVPESTPSYLKMHYRYYNTVLYPNQSWCKAFGLYSGFRLLSDIFFQYSNSSHFLLILERTEKRVANRVVATFRHYDPQHSEKHGEELALFLFENGLDVSFAPRKWIAGLPGDHYQVVLDRGLDEVLDYFK